MNAVNLIPSDARRDRGSSSGSGSGYGVYAVLGALAMLVAMVAVFSLANKQVTDREGDLARVQAESAAAEGRAAQLKPYTKFSSLSAARRDTVQQLVSGRFDWAHALREVARVLPAGDDLLTLKASRGAAAAGSPAAAAPAAPGATVGAPAFDVTGCTRSQHTVATLLARLRAVDGVARVSLSTSDKADAAAAGGAGGNTGDCRKRASSPQFKMTVSFREPPAVPPPASAPAGPATASATGAIPAPVPATQTVPAASGGTK